MSNTKFISAYGSNQFLQMISRIQQKVDGVNDEIVEDILNHCIADDKLPKTVLLKWKKSKRAEVKAKKAAKKAAKDPNAPKAPKSAYIRFTMSGVRDVIKKEHPEYKPKEITTEMGFRWKALNEEQRKPFLDEYEIEHKDFVERKRVYDSEHGKSKKRSKSEMGEMSERDQFYYNKFQQKFSYFPFNEKYNEEEKKEVLKQKRQFKKYLSTKYSENPEKLESMMNLVKKCKNVVLNETKSM